MNRLFLLLFGMVTFVAHAQVPDYVPTEGLVAWYPLDGDAVDASASNEAGELYGAYESENRFDEPNMALQFEGELSFVDLGMENLLSLSEDDTISIAFWAMAEGYGAPITKYQHLDYGSSWFVEYSPTYGYRMWGDGTSGTPNPSEWNSQCPNNPLAWTQVVVVFAGASGVLWLNGELICESDFPVSSLSQEQPVLLGRSNCTAGSNCNQFNGRLDDLGLWNRALTEEEILALYNAPSPAPGCTDTTACNYNEEANEDDGSCVYPPIIELGEDLISCEEAVVLEVGNGFSTYLWSTGETTPAIEVSESGMISVEVSIGLEGASEVQEIDGFTYIGELGQSRYYVSEASILWEEAKINCEMLGGHLVTISSPEENELVWQGVYGNGLNPGGSNNYQAWIGLYQNTNSPDYSEPDGGWEWVNGEPLNYLNWAPNQPNNSNQGYFAHMTDANGNCSEGDPVCGVWDDTNISWNLQSAFYVLELAPTSAYCSTVDSVYVDLDHGSCFCGLNAFWNSDVEECVGQTPSSDACGPGTYWDDIEMICLPMTTCQDDLDGDGVIGVNDLMQLLSSFGTDCAPAEEPESAEFTCGDPVNYQGYDYATVQIGEQCWFAENLRTEHYTNTDSIFQPGYQTSIETDFGETAVYGEYDWCITDYSNDACNPIWSLDEYGRLYNSYAVDDERGLCPTGWHVPTDGEWTLLTNILGGQSIAGVKMKRTSGWHNDGNGTNSSGFSALPGGYRYMYGSFHDAVGLGGWWSSTYTNDTSFSYWLIHDDSGLWQANDYPKTVMLSVRCLKDTE